MATLTIRNVDPEVQKQLRVRAALNGRSMEAELREIIRKAVQTPNRRGEQEESGLNLAEAIRRRFQRFGGVDLELPPREPARDPPDFSR